MTDILQGTVLLILAVYNVYQGRVNQKLRRDINVLLEAAEHLLRTKGNP